MRTLSLLAIALLVLATFAHAAPSEINYQGVLTDQNGNPVNGVRAMQIKIYDAPTGGSLLYSEELGNVPVQDGIYSFTFGANGSVSSTLGQNAGIFEVLSEYNQPWIEVVLAGVAQNPRQKFLQVPYALVARRAEVASGNLSAEISALRRDLAFAVGGWQRESLMKESFAAPTRLIAGETTMSGNPSMSAISETVSLNGPFAYSNQVLTVVPASDYVRYLRYGASVSGGTSGTLTFVFKYSDGSNNIVYRNDVFTNLSLKTLYYIANPRPDKKVAAIDIMMPNTGGFYHFCNIVYNTTGKLTLNLSGYALSPKYSKVGAFLEISDAGSDTFKIVLVGTTGSFEIPRDDYAEIPSGIGSPVKLVVTHSPTLTNNQEVFAKLKTVVLRFSQ
jgi:hypothetical protein